MFGGPADYTEQLDGYPRMLAYHRNLASTHEQRFRFTSLMSLAADDARVPDDPEFRAAFVGYVEGGLPRATPSPEPTPCMHPYRGEGGCRTALPALTAWPTHLLGHPHGWPGRQVPVREARALGRLMRSSEAPGGYGGPPLFRAAMARGEPAMDAQSLGLEPEQVRVDVHRQTSWLIADPTV